MVGCQDIVQPWNGAGGMDGVPGVCKVRMSLTTTPRDGITNDLHGYLHTNQG